MSNKFKSWLKCASIRCIKTVCQTALGTLGTAAVLTDVNWKFVLSASILSGIASILTSVVGLPEVEDSDISDDTAAMNVAIIDESELSEISELLEEE